MSSANPNVKGYTERNIGDTVFGTFFWIIEGLENIFFKTFNRWCSSFCELRKCATVFRIVIIPFFKLGVFIWGI